MKIPNEKEVKFCEEYVKNGYKPMRAYLAAFDTENKQTASSEAYKKLRQEHIQNCIEAIEMNFKTLGQMGGLDKNTIVKLLAEMANATKVVGGKEVPDWAAREKGIALFTKLAGEFVERHSLDVRG